MKCFAFMEPFRNLLLFTRYYWGDQIKEDGGGRDMQHS